MRDQGFEAVYPPLEQGAYQQRRDRIYTPKLEWILSRIGAAGLTRQESLGRRWLEIGCGAGYFLNALQAAGCRSFRGLDSNRQLVALANQANGQDVAQLAPASLPEAIDGADADIFAAFFVLEHLEDARAFWRAMAGKRIGTVFAFSVPMLGFATLLECAFDGFSARNLDSVLHTQLYTDASIDHALQDAGYERVAQWIFGQDATDLCRVISARVSASADDTISREMLETLAKLVDPLQAAIDRTHFADARHILAVKR